MWNDRSQELGTLPASGSFPMSQLFASGGRSIGVSALASVLPMNIQDWSPLGWTGWISLQSKWLSRVFSNTTVQKHNHADWSLWWSLDWAFWKPHELAFAKTASTSTPWLLTLLLSTLLKPTSLPAALINALLCALGSMPLQMSLHKTF